MKNFEKISLSIRWLKIVVAFVFVVTVSSYFFVENSDAHKSATSFLSKSNEINRQVGEVKSIKLMPYSYSIKIDLGGGSASLLYSINGSKGHVRAKTALTKKEGEWKVRAIEINGEKILVN